MFFAMKIHHAVTKKRTQTQEFRMESFKKISFQITNLNEGDLKEESSSMQKRGTKRPLLEAFSTNKFIPML